MEHDPDPFDEADEPGDEDEVGYGKPPRHTRWPPGYCPNRRGRPRNAKGRKTILERIANEICEVKIAGRQEVRTRVEVVLFALRNATANGSALAQKLFDGLLREVMEEGPQVPKGVLITGEKYTIEEWEEIFGGPNNVGTGVPPAPIQMAHVSHLLPRNP